VTETHGKLSAPFLCTGHFRICSVNYAHRELFLFSPDIVNIGFPVYYFDFINFLELSTRL